ncbi:diguanylate cyclase [Rhizobium sp. 0TCS1.26]|uniref:histidine kinase N-terminal 7TM domain-containing diguanylate cyclase n=1 Tax=Rhizobium sp. 0TCS1.26 TaxID=3142623 RepID=UPI003D2AF964
MGNSVWLLGTIVVLAALIIFCALRAPNAPGRTSFTLSVLLALFWTGCVLFRHSVTDLELRIIACKFAWFGIMGTPLFWSLSFITYARGAEVERPWQLASIGAISAAFGILAVTNEWHNALYIRLLDETTLSFEYGWLYTVALILGNSAMVLSCVYGLAISVRLRGIHRWQMWALLASAVLPWMANVSYTAYGFMLFNDDPTPFVFAATGAFMLGAQLFGQLFVLPPIGRDAIFSVLPDPVIVLDARRRILELNPAAQSLPDMPSPAIGRLLAGPPELVAVVAQEFPANGHRRETRLAATGRTYEISCHSLIRWGRTGGQMIVMRDITLRKADEFRMAALSQDLEARLAENLRLQGLLREEALRDHLTGLFNRRHAQALLPELLADAAAPGPIAIAVLDIDHFKSFNDRFGHQTGDDVLRTFAEVLKSGLGDNDLIFRWGGEEFLAVLPALDREAVLARIAGWQAWLAGRPINGVSDTSLTFSGGVFLAEPGSSSLEDAVRAADIALYAAKAAGRNRIVMFDSTLDNLQPKPRPHATAASSDPLRRCAPTTA